MSSRYSFCVDVGPWAEAQRAFAGKSPDSKGRVTRLGRRRAFSRARGSEALHWLS